jgi:hypothetical protein
MDIVEPPGDGDNPAMPERFRLFTVVVIFVVLTGASLLVAPAANGQICGTSENELIHCRATLRERFSLLNHRN